MHSREVLIKLRDPAHSTYYDLKQQLNQGDHSMLITNKNTSSI